MTLPRAPGKPDIVELEATKHALQEKVSCIGANGTINQDWRAKNGRRFLWVQFKCTGGHLPHTVDLLKVVARDERNRVCPAVGLSTDTSRPRPHAQVVFGLSNNVVMAFSSGGDIEYSFDARERGKASADLKIVRVPVGFSLLFTVPPGATTFTVHGLNSNPVEVNR